MASEAATVDLKTKPSVMLSELEKKSTNTSEAGHPTPNDVEKLPKTDSTVEPEYPTGVRLVLLTLALAISVFLVALDNTIIATAIPKISTYFDSLEDIGWYGSAYLLTSAAFQLLWGRLYTFLPIKWVYIAAISIFELGSLICGVAPTSAALIIGRAIAGVGCAGIFSGALIIVAHSAPLPKRPMFTGLIGSTYGIASVAGPLMGGAFADKVTWRWCFLINLPIGAVTLFIMVFLFTNPHQEMGERMDFRHRLQQFDLIGTAIIIPAVVCLLLALQWGGAAYAWSNPRIIALLVLFGVLTIVFIAVQVWKQDSGTVPPRIFKQRSIWSGALFAFFQGATFFVFVFYLPIWFQAIKGVSAIKSGIDNLPMILSLVFAMILSGGLTTAIGYVVPFMYLSTILMAVGGGLLTTLQVDTGHAKWIAYQVLVGIGCGAGMNQPVMAIQAVLDLKDVPTGTAVVLFLQTMGGSIFVSVAQNVFQNQLVSGLRTQVPSVDPRVLLGAGAASIRAVVPGDVLGAVIRVYNTALVNAFYVAVAAGCLSAIGALVIEWKSIKVEASKE
ncbi:Major facilitator superfamily transporter [Mycena indigotica]|uniref:Major facilitator superfamily transporter n=1 Tax=Mycena indigotica TaxID=2126181 RepID=A0A8H6T6L1_9AGAR|nr:Major facilitator superfamily transporter [Mycena indigotica]KAF7312733.1 Major facilitator superfamily transporter [Mycena indigotica]